MLRGVCRFWRKAHITGLPHARLDLDPQRLDTATPRHPSYWHKSYCDPIRTVHLDTSTSQRRLFGLPSPANSLHEEAGR